MLPFIINKPDNVGASLIYSGTPSTSEPEYWNVYYSTANSNPAPETSGTTVIANTSKPTAYIRTPSRYKCTEKQEVAVYEYQEGAVAITKPCPCYYLYTSYSVNSTNDNITLSGRSSYSIPTSYTNTMLTGSTYGRVASGTAFSSSTYITSINKSTPTKVSTLTLYQVTLSNGSVYYTCPAVASTVSVTSGTAYEKGQVKTYVRTDYYIKVTGTSHYVKLNSNMKTYETPFVYTISGSGTDMAATKVNALVACCMYPYINNSIIYSRNAPYLPIAEVRDSGKSIYPYLFDTSAAQVRKVSNRLCVVPRHNTWQSIVTTGNNESWTNYYGIKITCDFYTGAFLGKYDRQLFGFGANVTSPTSTSQLQHVRCFLSKSGDIRLYINNKLTYPSYPFRDNQKKICQLEIDINPTKTAQSSLRIFTDYEKNIFSYASGWDHVSSSNGVLSSKLPDLGTIAFFGVAKAGNAVSSWTTPGYNSSDEGISASPNENSSGILRFTIDFYNQAGEIVKTNNYYAAKTANSLATRCGFIDDMYNSEMVIPLGYISISLASPATWLLDYYSIP